MKKRFQVICLLAILQPALLWSLRGSYRILQIPKDSTVSLAGPKMKITFQISSNDSYFDSEIQLYARIDTNTITDEQRETENEYVVIYNSCGDSNEPDLFCKEAQVTILGENVTHDTVSFHLYNRTTRMQLELLSSIALEQANAVNRTNSSRNSNTGVPVPTAITGAVINAPGLYSAMGLLAVALAASCVVILALASVLFVTCKTLRNQRRTKDLEANRQPEVAELKQTD